MVKLLVAADFGRTRILSVLVRTITVLVHPLTPPQSKEASTMALMNFLRGQAIDVIEWTDDSRDTISFRFPDEDKEIKNGAQLIVRESQVAQFVYLGEFGDTFGPGKHTLTTDNIPILTKLKSWKYGFNSPFKADVYYVTTRLFTGNKWGTANPIMMRDQDFGIVRVRAFGSYDFRVSDPKLMLKEVAGSDQNFRLEEFTDAMRSRIVSVFSDALATAKVPVLDVAARYQEVGEALLPLINPIIQAKYGVEIASFILENVSVPPEVEAAIDKRSSMAAVGNLNDFVKFQMAQGMEKGGSAGGAATEMAVGIAMANQIIQQQSSLQSTAPSGSASATAPAAAASPAMPELLTPAQAAEALGVTEADVMQSLEAGDLKGKKIGSSYRITRAALAAFLQS
jgi:excisionase family DNA binding protein